MDTLRLGTRGSELALFQANAVAALLLQHARTASDIMVIKTSGDRLADASLAQIGGKRLFVKEIEDALLAGEVDLAVHSSKDMPAALPAGLQVGAVLAREDPHDAIVLPGSAPALPIQDVVKTLGDRPRIGTSSVRRIAQLSRLFPGATFLPVRGNLGTRLRKLDAGEYDALVLAAAGLRRLGRGDRITAAVPADVCVPAPGQGIIAVENSRGRRTREACSGTNRRPRRRRGAARRARRGHSPGRGVPDADWRTGRRQQHRADRAGRGCISRRQPRRTSIGDGLAGGRRASWRGCR
jgi:hydroxymethylbilane synthase